MKRSIHQIDGQYYIIQEVDFGHSLLCFDDVKNIVSYIVDGGVSTTKFAAMEKALYYTAKGLIEVEFGHIDSNPDAEFCNIKCVPILAVAHKNFMWFDVYVRFIEWILQGIRCTLEDGFTEEEVNFYNALHDIIINSNIVR